MKIYLASSWSNAPLVRFLAAQLELEGPEFEVDAFCTATDKRFSFHWSNFVKDEAELIKYDAISFISDERVQKAYKQDREWIDWADTVIMVMPCGRSSHLEGGYAVGQGKRLFLYGEFPKGEFDVMYGFASGLFRTEEYHLLVKALKNE